MITDRNYYKKMIIKSSRIYYSIESITLLKIPLVMDSIITLAFTYSAFTFSVFNKDMNSDV